MEDDLPYKPVAHDHEAFLKKALKRKDFRKSYEDLGEEYRLAREMLTARFRIGLTHIFPNQIFYDRFRSCSLASLSWR